MKISENISLSDKTSYRIGGPARYYAEPGGEDEIVDLCGYALERGLPVFVLGNGSNILVSDKGINGLVINLSANFTAIDWETDDSGVAIARAQGGASLDGLVREAVKRGLSGMEELSGIPGTVGGAVVMNAGAFDTEIAQTLCSVRVLRMPSSSKTIESVDAKNLSLGYRSSALKGTGDILLSATFKFMPERTPGLAAETRSGILSRRREKQPLDKPNCGSVFKRPPGGYAGTLIESCGLKGYKLGGAMVSDKHANFIVNTGGATACDVRGVIRHVQNIVCGKTGVMLEPEVIFVGEV